MPRRNPMIRKQLYIKAEQAAQLAERSQEYRISEGQLVREALDSYLSRPFRIGQIDLEAWREEFRFIKSRNQSSGKTPGKAQRWKREDIYEC